MLECKVGVHKEDKEQDKNNNNNKPKSIVQTPLKDQNHNRPKMETDSSKLII